MFFTLSFVHHRGLPMTFADTSANAAIRQADLLPEVRCRRAKGFPRAHAALAFVKALAGTRLAFVQAGLKHLTEVATLMANDNHNWRMGWKGLVGIASCGIGLGVVYFGYGIGTESPKKNAAAEARLAAAPKDKRPVRAMNLALGNMVYFAHDLGFSVKNDAGASVDPSKIAARIENQLNGMRSLYRQEIAKNAGLVGNLILQFHVSPSGEVSQIRELSGRLNDAEFKKAAIAQAGTWSFAELVSENLEVTCPLLFVHEGMDITTLVQWEKSVEASVVKTTAARPTPAPVNAAAHANGTSGIDMRPG